ncbi:MAG: PD-(D/E)XK nuclease family protein [Victivallales bacterium]|nr:PD-(D/E)XK nuclease family protein [Victivallales bacterium]
MYQKRELKNELSWSVSRAQLFQSCPRAYYYTYYGSWKGWELEAPEETRLLYRLKKLSTMPIWAGTIVHDLLKGTLERARETGSIPALETLQNAARAKMREGWLQTINQEWLKSPSKAVNLSELYYGAGENYGICRKLPKEETDAILQRVMDCLDNFTHSPIIKEIFAVPAANWKPIDTLTYFMVGDIKVYCAIDFAFEDAAGFLHIIDWKTGNENPRTLRQQLACYARYAVDTWGYPVDRLILQGVFLRDGGRVSQYTVNQELMDSVCPEIEKSYHAMQARLTSIEENTAQEENFTPRPSETGCSTFNFRQVCPVTKELMGKL